MVKLIDWRALGAVMVSAVLAAGCGMRMMPGMGGMGPMGGGHMGGAGRGANAAAATVVDGGREITVAATEFGFEPMTIQVKVGEAINIVFLNQGVLEHDLTITDYGLYLFAQPGETIVGGLTAEGAGEYEIICSVPGHAEAGMRGLLVVTEL